MANVGAVAQTFGAVEQVVMQLRRATRMTMNENIAEMAVSRVETILLLVASLSGRESLMEMAPVILMYLKTWYPNQTVYHVFARHVKSIVQGAVAYYNEDDDLAPQSGWFTANWDKVCQGSFGKGLASLVCLLLTAGMLEEKTSTTVIKEFLKILPMRLVQSKSKSIFHYLFSTLDWIVDCVVPACTTGDMSLLIRDEKTAALDESYRIACDAVRRSMSGQIASVKELYGIGSEAEILTFLQEVSEAHAKYKQFIEKDDVRRKEIQLRLLSLDKLVVDFTATWHDKALREKPYTFMLVGGSSVGKSTLAGIIAHVICTINDIPQGKEYFCTLNANDKYQSEFRSNMTYVLLDDVGNTRPEMTEVNPCDTVIKWSNNVHCAALSADVEMKGKNDIRVNILGITSNTPDMHAGHLSVNSASVMRRNDLYIEVALKEGAADANGGMHPKFAGDAQPDAWCLKIYTIKVVRSSQDALADTWMKIPVFPQEHSMSLAKESSLIDLIDYLADVTPGFYRKQKKLVDTSCELHKKEHCKHHPLYVLPCKKCISLGPDWHALEKQGGMEVSDLLLLRGQLREMIDTQTSQFRTPPEEIKFTKVKDECKSTPWERVEVLCTQTRQGLSEMVTKAKAKFNGDDYLKVLAGVAAIGMAGLAVYQMCTPDKLHAEGAILSRIERAARDPTLFVEKENKYQRVYTNRNQFPKASTSSTIDSFESKVDQNLYLIEVQMIDEKTQEPIGGSTWANAFPVGSCCWATVGHLFDKESCYRVHFRCSPFIGVKRVTVMISEANAKWHPCEDIVVLNVPHMGDNADLTKYMPDPKVFQYEKGVPLQVYHCHRSQVYDCENPVPPSSYKMLSKLVEIAPRAVLGVGKSDLLKYFGENHHGMCGSLVVQAGRNPTIIGMHCAGSQSTQECGAVVLDRDFLHSAIAEFGGVFVKESAPLPESLYDKQLGVTTTVHPKNPIHFLEGENHNLEVYGQHSLALSKFKSDVIQSPLQEALCENLGIQPEHYAPAKDSARPSYQKFLSRGSEYKPEKLVNPRYVNAAVADLKTHLAPRIEKIQEFVHQLTLGDALNGVPGLKGYEPVNPLTSMGFPLNAAKYKFFEKCDLSVEQGLDTVRYVSKQLVDGEERYVYELKFDASKADVLGTTESILEMWLDGYRANSIYRANLKDEPVSLKKLEAKKVRVFAGAPVAFVIAARMMLLTSLQLSTNFPSIMEDAVGVNATGRDWAHLAAHLGYFGLDSCGDGDFSAFDQDVDPAFHKAGKDVKRWFLEKCGFSSEQLSIFDGIATEELYPIFELDGLLFKMHILPSGAPDTVESNGYSNRLMMRYCYYSMHEADFGQVPFFAQVIRLLVYGDDNAFNVDTSREKLFNMMSVRDEMEKIGMTYTTSGKGEHDRPFKHRDELSFLKRKFWKHPQLGEMIGKLEKESIYKSLLLARKPKKGQNQSMAEIAAQNLNGALRELYFHDESEYDFHLPVFLKVARASVDREGFKVSDFFQPVTKEEIIAGFHSTFSCYDQALLKIGEVPLEKQSGSCSESEDSEEDESDDGYPECYEVGSGSYQTNIRFRRFQLESEEQAMNRALAHNERDAAYRHEERCTELEEEIEELLRAEVDRVAGQVLVRELVSFTHPTCITEICSSMQRFLDLMQPENSLYPGQTEVVDEIAISSSDLLHLNEHFKTYDPTYIYAEDRNVCLTNPDHFFTNRSFGVKYVGPDPFGRAMCILSAILRDLLHVQAHQRTPAALFVLKQATHTYNWEDKNFWRISSSPLWSRLIDDDYVADTLVPMHEDWTFGHALEDVAYVDHPGALARHHQNQLSEWAPYKISTLVWNELQELEFIFGTCFMFPRFVEMHRYLKECEGLVDLHWIVEEQSNDLSERSASPA